MSSQTLDYIKQDPLSYTPTALTPDVKDCIVAATKEGLYIDDACALSGISKQTYYTWLKAAELGNPQCIDLVDAIKKAEAEHKQEKLSQIAKAGKTPHYWQAAAWHLERRYPQEYGQRGREELLAAREIRIEVHLEGRQRSPLAGQVIEGEARELPEPGLTDDKGT